jgi:hypothetical protein
MFSHSPPSRERRKGRRSDTCTFAQQDVYARLRVNVSSALLETPVSPNNKESGSKSGSGVLPLASPPASDPTLDLVDRHLQLEPSFAEARNNQKVVAQPNWPGSPTVPSPLPLDLVYELWNTYVSDEEESGILLSVESSVDGDIFGVGKRPVQREIEKDGCIQLVFVKE